MPSAHEITQLLQAWSAGDGHALERLTPLVYNELHRTAKRYMARERPDHTLQATALIDEVYLRLVDCDRVSWQDRNHFFAVCARLMRRILTLTIRELLAQNDSADKQFQSEAALTRSYFGKTYADIVAAGHLSFKEKTAYCQESRKLLEPAFSDYLRKRKEGKLPFGDDSELADMQKVQSQCATVLATARGQ